jgi:hypothetical protein
MPDYSVIADVSETLRDVLTAAFAANMGPTPPVAEVHDLSGNISTSPARLTLFLFEVSEDSSLRNRPAVQNVVPPVLTLQKPPMPLVLRYLATPWSGDRVTDHRILGRTLQTLYDEAIISGPALTGGLANTSEALKIKLVALELEDRARVWHAIQRPYRISLVYEVRFVNLDPTGFEIRAPVNTRQLDTAAPAGSA